jgi:hypothetical protein
MIVAVVLLLQGSVEVVDPSGDAEAAELGDELTAEHMVRTDWDSSVVLHLHNDHLVRVDEDLELAIKDVVLLNADPTSDSIDTQLASLLQPGELNSMTGIDDTERLAGWHSRLTASATVGATTEGPGGRARRNLSTSAMEREESAPEEKMTMDDDAEGGSPPEEEDAGEEVAQPAAPPPPGPLALDSQQAQAVASCLSEWRADNPSAAVLLDLRIKSGVVKKVRLVEGKTPACLSDVLVGAPVDSTERRLSVPYQLGL